MGPTPPARPSAPRGDLAAARERPDATPVDGASVDDLDQAAVEPGLPGPRDERARRLYLDTLYTAATMYYVEDATQVQISQRLGRSRTTISRLLAEARRLGMVRTEVVRPRHLDPQDLADRVREVLGVRAVHVGPAGSRDLAVSLGPTLGDVLAKVGLVAGDVLLVSSGRHTYEVAQGPLPRLPGVRVVPTIGGIDQSQAWYQPNQIVQQVAAKIGGDPLLLFAPALPGAGLYEQLLDDPGTRRVMQAWSEASCAVVGIGAPPRTRASLPSFVDTGDDAIMGAAGDVASRFYDAEGVPVRFEGVDRIVATPLERFRELPHCIAVATGEDKVPSILAAARAGYFTDLVTDAETATALAGTT